VHWRYGFTSRPCGKPSGFHSVEGGDEWKPHIPDEMVIYFSPCYWFSGTVATPQQGTKLALTKTTWTINTLLNLFDE
jgi:hypothetical protein